MSSQQARSKREMPIAEVVRLIDLVNYQEGAVVSRTLVDEGQGLSEHTAPFDAVAHLLEGDAEIGCLASHYGRRQAKRFSCQQINRTL